jgi:ABC-type antimicrobial peptide transport system permease subunit
VFVELDSSIDRATTLEQLKERINATDQDLTVIDINQLLGKSVAFLGSAWSTVLLLPSFTLASATLCLIAYVMLALDEQHQEFGILRAIGAKPKTIVNIVAFQTSVILASSLALGISFGVIATLLILMPQPIVTNFTILQIASWLAVASAIMFFLSLIPAVRFARTPLLRILT